MISFKYNQKSWITIQNIKMTSLTTLVSTTLSVANAAVVFTNWEANSGVSMKLSEAMNQYRDCVSIADDYQLNPNLCSQQNGLGIVMDLANSMEELILDSYDYTVSNFHFDQMVSNIFNKNAPFLKFGNSRFSKFSFVFSGFKWFFIDGLKLEFNHFRLWWFRFFTFIWLFWYLPQMIVILFDLFDTVNYVYVF